MLTSQEQFLQVLREFAEVFMRRSLRDFYHFTRDSGLSFSQLSTLMYLFYRDQCGVSDLGTRLGVTNAAASQLIDKLVQQGLLTRAEDQVDRRAKHIALTPAGRALIEQAIEARRKWLEELTETLSPAERSAIMAALERLTQAANDLDRAGDQPAGAPQAHRKEI